MQSGALQRTNLLTYYAALGLGLAAAIAPMWMVTFPGMIDYPSHLVRCYILAHFGSNPFWPHFYRVQFGPIPNLAMDAIVTPLAHWLPIVVSGQIFLTLLALVYFLGCSELAQAAWGQPQWLALVAGLTLYNATLLWGFVNYLFGLGLFFLAFAVWLRLRRRLTAGRFVLLCGWERWCIWRIWLPWPSWAWPASPSPCSTGGRGAGAVGHGHLCCGKPAGLAFPRCCCCSAS